MNNNDNSRIGVHCWGTSPESIALLTPAAESGARWVRATRPMQWDTMTTGQPRGYDFAKAGEHSVDRAIELGMSVMGILDARWGNETLHNDLPFASPVWDHLDLWSDWVSATVNHYKGRVKHWEVLNEPPFFWWYPTPESVTYAEEADCPLKRAPIRRYVELLAATACAVRAADPEAKIVLGSGFSDGAFLEKVYKLGGKEYFDIASVHYIPCDHPEKFARSMRRLRSVMAAYGDEGKPLWDTENGPSGAVIGQEVSTPEAYESLYNVYRHCFAHEFGLDRYFWFNVPTASVHDPTYRSLEVMHDVVGEGELIRSRHIGEEMHGYAFRGPGGPVTALWSTAPAVVHFTQAVEGVTYLGEPLTLRGERAMDGRPIFVYGDILDQIDAEITGKRTAVTVSMKQPPANTPNMVAHHLPADLPPPQAATPPDPGRVRRQPYRGLRRASDDAWATVPYFCRASELTLAETTHFAKVPSSVTADVKLAYDSERLHVRAHIFDDLADPVTPEGVILMTVRDSDPAVSEWPYFTNGYGLFVLYASKRGPMVMRYESSDIEGRPTGRIDSAEMTVTPTAAGYEVTASIPWLEIGPCRPGKHNPFLVMMTFTRTDNALDVPDGDEPEEWSHNFADSFIVKQPAAPRWVTIA